VGARFRLDRTLALQCLAVAAGTALVRVPFMGSVGPDEGGYAYVASEWSHGGALYRSVWIDRPQGLVVVYRALLSLGDSAWTIRLGAVAAAVAVALLLIAIGDLLVSRTAGLLAGSLYAFVGIGPRIEGYTFNGELAAAVPSTAAVAAALLAARRRSRAWFAIAGALGACGVLMKQSGFDGLVVAAVVAAWSGSRRASAERLATVLAGAAVPLGASALAGVVSGWHFYWSALVGSHLAAATTLSARLHHLGESLPGASRDLLPIAIAAAFGAWHLRRRRAAHVAFAWVAAAALAVNVGGLYWPHYYVQLLAPLALLGGVGLAALPRPRAWAAAAVIAFPAAFFVGDVLASPDARSDRLVKYALGFENDQRIAQYVRAHTRPNQPVYGFQSRADLYFLADRRSASPYLWAHALKDVPGARAALERTLAGQRRPSLVVLFQHPHHDRFGRRIDSILARDYREVWRAPRTGTEVLAPVSAGGASPPPAD
jgi:4-amino-4-deoxy-L-arabinose transferase-like glycosyltransferase